MKYKFWILLLIPIFMTGCWNYKELSDMAIVSGIAVDKDGDNYIVNFLITNAQKPDNNSQDGSADMTILSGEGRTMTEAINKLDLKSPKTYYLGHVSSLIVSEKASKDMEKITDFFFRNPESIKKFYLIISHGKAVDTLKIISPLEMFPSESIISNLKEINEEQAIISETVYSDFLNDVLTEGINPTVASIKISGKIKNADDEEDLNKTDLDTFVEVDSMALFNGYKFVKFASADESRGINVIKNNVKSLYMTTKCDNGRTIVEATNVKTDIKYEIKNEKPIFTLSSSADIQLQETTCGYNLKKDKTIEEIEKMYEKELKKIINKAINLAKQEKVDVFGFGNLIYKSDYSYWKNNRKKWNEEIFSDLEVKVKTEINLISSGSIENTRKGLLENER